MSIYNSGFEFFCFVPRDDLPKIHLCDCSRLRDVGVNDLAANSGFSCFCRCVSSLPQPEDLDYGQARLSQLKAKIFKRKADSTGKKRVFCNHCSTYFSCQGALAKHLHRVKRKEKCPEDVSKDVAILSQRPLSEIRAAFYKNKSAVNTKAETTSDDFSDQSGRTLRSAKPIVNTILTKNEENNVVVLKEEALKEEADEVVSNDCNDDPDYEESVDEKPLKKSKGGKNKTLVVCKCCNNFFSSKQLLRAHIKTTHKDSVPLLCHICGKQLSCRQSLRQHQLVHQPPDSAGKHRCTVCSAEFTIRANLVRHMYSHPTFSVKKFICELCGKRFGFQGALTRHVRIHSDERPFACRICPLSFKSTSNRRSHEAQVHKIGTIPSQFHCKLCRKDFLKKEAYDRHMGMHSGVLPFKCTTCHKKFTSELGLNIHMTVGRCDKYIHNCAECQKTFKADDELCEHLLAEGGQPRQIKPPKEKKVACSLCDRKFAFMSQVRVHMSLAHSDVKPFQCQHCEKSFKRDAALRLHMRMHGAEKRYPCPYCPKRFFSTSNLRCHVRVHTGEKPYVCDVCGRGFAQSGDRNKHRQKIHENRDHIGVGAPTSTGDSVPHRDPHIHPDR